MKNTLPSILHTDGYKLGHRNQYPDGTQYVYSNLTARTSRTEETHTVFFGLQAFITKNLVDGFADFFASDVDEVCEYYENRLLGYLGPNNVGSDHIRALHDLGYLPLEFRALPEGTKTPLRVPMLTVHNTHPEFFWLVNYIETMMSAEMWHPITTATTAASYRTLLDMHAQKTGVDDDFFVSIQGHDFSMRGQVGVEAAAASGAGHLLSFIGTDTLPALDYIDNYYPIPNPDPMYMKGISVNASEHAVMSAGTSVMGEFETFRRLITEVYPTGIVSLVSDTFDLWEVLTDFMPRLKETILNRGEGSRTVIRPDSGDPVKIICGDPEAPPGSPERAGVIQLLWDTFGGTETATGHKVLNPYVGAIYGDAITHARADEICNLLASNGFASSNIVFGIGSFTYQYVTRDTYGMAVKATAAVVNDEHFELFKDPITDSGTKKSAKGYLAVRRDETSGELALIDQLTFEESSDSLLEPVWRDGKFLRTQSFQEIREVLGLQA